MRQASRTESVCPSSVIAYPSSFLPRWPLTHMRFCPYCGKSITDRAKFCPMCGKSTPQRQRTGALIIEGAPTATLDADGSSEAQSFTANLRLPAVTAEEGANDQAAATPVNGRQASARSRPYAPPTRFLVGEMEHTGFGLRYGAWMFDFLITLIAIMTFTFVVTALSNRSVVEANQDLILVTLLTLLLILLNFVAFAGRTGQTIGMRILGIRIAKLNGQPFTIKDALVRHLIGYPLAMLGLFLGFLWVLWDPRQQGWHDKLAKTVVVMSR